MQIGPGQLEMKTSPALAPRDHTAGAVTAAEVEEVVHLVGPAVEVAVMATTATATAETTGVVDLLVETHHHTIRLAVPRWSEMTHRTRTPRKVPK